MSIKRGAGPDSLQGPFAALCLDSISGDLQRDCSGAAAGGLVLLPTLRAEESAVCITAQRSETTGSEGALCFSALYHLNPVSVIPC